MNGKQMDASIVFIEAFKYIKKIVMKRLTRNANEKGSRSILKIKDIYDIQWIVTVPAIWDDIAKNKMITWIQMAGLTDKNIQDHCLLKYEPDCASLSLQYQILNKTTMKNDDNLFNDDEKNSGSKYLKGKKYILIDAGAGTVDIACHEFINNYSVKELHYPTGGPWGDMYVDVAFEYLFQHLLGQLFIKAKKPGMDKNRIVELISRYYNNNITFKDLMKSIFGDEILRNIPNLNDNVYFKILKDHKISNIKNIDVMYMLYGVKVFKNIKNEDQSIYFDLLQSFRATKFAFEDVSDNKFIGVKLFDELIDAIDSQLGDDMFADSIEECEYNGNQNCFAYDEDTFILGIKCLIFKKHLYDPFINPVINHVQKLLARDSMQNCSYIYMVGGYSKTEYFQSRIKSTFGLKTEYKIDVIIPPNPLLSVVDGAARMGLLGNINRQYVKIRVLSKTYGEILTQLYEDIDLHHYSPKFIQDNTQIINGQKHLCNCFYIYARIGDAIPLNKTIKFHSSRENTNHTSIHTVFFSSPKRNPKTIHDGTKLTECSIKWPINDDSLEITTEITFGEMIKAVSYPTNMPQLTLETEFQYDWK